MTAATSRPTETAAPADGGPPAAGAAPRRPSRRRRHGAFSAWLWLLPALAFYATFVLYPLGQSVQYSFYRWDGIGPASPAGLANWRAIFTQPELLDSIGHAFVLIVFYALIPVTFGLTAASLIR